MASRLNLICDVVPASLGLFPKHAVTAKAGLKQDLFTEQEV